MFRIRGRILSNQNAFGVQAVSIMEARRVVALMVVNVRALARRRLKVDLCFSMMTPERSQMRSVRRQGISHGSGGRVAGIVTAALDMTTPARCLEVDPEIPDDGGGGSPEALRLRPAQAS